MKKCQACKDEFKPKKTFHYLCGSCIKRAAKCKTCGKIVMPKKGEYRCCGHVEGSRPSRLHGKSLDEMVFILENNMTYDQAASFYGMDDFLEPPNSD
jgi:hypothetical protein